MAEDTCVICRGAGVVRCHQCEGTGMIAPPGFKPVRCYACEGKGRERCGDCDGTGTWRPIEVEGAEWKGGTPRGGLIQGLRERVAERR